MALISSFVSAEDRLKKTRATRSSSRPDRSMATRVFSKVAGSEDDAMASISSICSAIPRSNAAR